MNWRLICVVAAVAAFCVVSFPFETVTAGQDATETHSFLTAGVDSVLTLAQDDESSGSTRSSRRGTGKLIGLAIAGIIGLGSFVIKMFRGQK